jgi:hypothetical protein
MSIIRRPQKRRYQATLDFYRKISDQCDTLVYAMNAKFPNNDITDPYQVNNDGDTLKTVEKFLFLMEEVSAGINAKVFDIRVFGQITGEDYIRWFKRLKDVIESHRTKFNYPTLYRYYEEMVKNLERIRKKKFS